MLTTLPYPTPGMQINTPRIEEKTERFLSFSFSPFLSHPCRYHGHDQCYSCPSKIYDPAPMMMIKTRLSRMR